MITLYILDTIPLCFYTIHPPTQAYMSHIFFSFEIINRPQQAARTDPIRTVPALSVEYSTATRLV